MIVILRALGVTPVWAQGVKITTPAPTPEPHVITSPSAGDVERIVARVDERAREKHPEIVDVLITPQSKAASERSRTRRFPRVGSDQISSPP